MGRVLTCALGAVLALGIAGLALAGIAGRVLDARAQAAHSDRARDLAALSYLAGREQRLVAAGKADAATLRQLHEVLQRLGRSSATAPQLQRIVTPALSALVRAEQGKDARAARGFAGVAAAARAAALDEAAAAAHARSGTLPRLEEWAAVAAALLAAVLALSLLLGRVKRRAVEPDERVEELAAEARTDSLTGLGNHRAFNETLSAAIARRSATNTPFVLLAIDLDGLKAINDTDGHLAGDTYIKRVAECLRTVVGSRGTVHRTGGDEFMVILPGRRNWDGLAIARRIEETARQVVGRRALSIGVTESTGTEGRHLLVAQADLALYEAKRTKLHAVVFNPGLAKPGTSAGAQHDGPGPEQRALAAALARAVDAKDTGMQSHCETVAQLAVAIGERLGMSGSDLERLRIAGLLHDVGKIGVADAILHKPDELDRDERSEMASHVEIGHAILLAAELPVEAEWVLSSHEHYDGRGYPGRRRAGEIPLASRIIAVADAFEAMTSDRPYRPGMPVAEAIAELRRLAGTQFDGRCVNALVEVISEPHDGEAGADSGSIEQPARAVRGAALQAAVRGA